MKNFIENPIKHSEWDPSKGDFISHSVFEEDKRYYKRQQKKKTFITILAITHILLLFIIFLMY